ncbi:MAG: hypothetical protein ACRD6X_19310, partial [Pyrinomonadaceae bacterium]
MTNDEDEPTRRFADGDESSDNTGEHYRPETEPTLLRETDKIANEPAILGESYENDFAPSRVRFILICLLFAFTAVWLVVNNYNLFSIVADIDLVAEWRSGVHRVVWVAPQLSDKIEVGDQVLSIDGQPLDAKYSYRKYVRRFGADETHLFRFEREGAPF